MRSNHSLYHQHLRATTNRCHILKANPPPTPNTHIRQIARKGQHTPKSDFRGLKIPPRGASCEVQYYMWDTCTSYFGPKKFDRVGRGGQRRSKYGPEWASLLYIFGLGAFQRPLNGSRTPEMDSNQSGAVGGIILGVFQGSLTHLGASKRLRGQRYIKGVRFLLANQT